MGSDGDELRDGAKENLYTRRNHDPRVIWIAPRLPSSHDVLGQVWQSKIPPRRSP